MRENISSTRTKQMMVDALEYLLEEKGLDKITIQDITKKCGINRQTFYYHFHDIFELAEYMSKSYTEQVLGDEIDIENWDKALLNAADFLLEKKNMVMNLIKSLGHQYITNFLTEYIRPYITNIISKVPEAKYIDDTSSSFISNFYTITFSAILVEWLVSGWYKTTPANELVQKLKITYDGNIEAALKNYKAHIKSQTP